jgi:hypothetical protein
MPRSDKITSHCPTAPLLSHGGQRGGGSGRPRVQGLPAAAGGLTEALQQVPTHARIHHLWYGDTSFILARYAI